MGRFRRVAADRDKAAGLEKPQGTTELPVIEQAG